MYEVYGNEAEVGEALQTVRPHIPALLTAYHDHPYPP
jgi:hypothetical protein